MKAQKITYFVPVTVKISGCDMNRLTALIREKWDMRDDQEVNDEDILIEADAEKILPEPLPIGFKM
jgi:hypothetical protein